MGVPALANRRPPLSRRQALGIALACVILASGRGIRHWLLVGPEGRWRAELWLDERVLAPQEAPPADQLPALTAPLPINSCSTDSLTLLPGVGAVLAGRIDEVRRRDGPFRSLADLQKVKGIGPVLAARLESLVVFLPLAAPFSGPPGENPASPARPGPASGAP